jgi:nucleotide-binding universal stress UspA family protein
MVTHGHDGLRDVLLSSHTERILHEAKLPLLWVPPGFGVKP